MLISVSHWENHVLDVLQSGLTPLHLTAQEDRVNAAEVLGKHDANIDQQTKVQTSSMMHSKTLQQTCWEVWQHKIATKKQTFSSLTS